MAGTLVVHKDGELCYEKKWSMTRRDKIKNQKNEEQQVTEEPDESSEESEE